LSVLQLPRLSSCNALQRTATHCNALQRTATHQLQRTNCNAPTATQFESPFGAVYSRNNKAKSAKHMRCFPECAAVGHAESKFCGADVNVLMYPSQQPGPGGLLSFDLGMYNDPTAAFVCLGQFVDR
jgi:hypothetical protein